MPFIAKGRRQIIDERGLDSLADIYPGDRCYNFYKPMVDRWKSNPRWSTAHEIYKELHYMPVGRIGEDDWVAKDLAWQVFFIKYVWPYEQKKIEENGDI
jgi:hypothetical protein